MALKKWGGGFTNNMISTAFPYRKHGGDMSFDRKHGWL